MTLHSTKKRPASQGKPAGSSLELERLVQDEYTRSNEVDTKRNLVPLVVEDAGHVVRERRGQDVALVLDLGAGSVSEHDVWELHEGRLHRFVVRDACLV